MDSTSPLVSDSPNNGHKSKNNDKTANTNNIQEGVASILSDNSCTDNTKHTPLTTAFMEAESRLRQNAQNNSSVKHTMTSQGGDNVTVETSSINRGGSRISDKTDRVWDETDGPSLEATGDRAHLDKPDGPEIFDESLFNPVLKTNQYQVRKSAARALMDAALMMANISQLRTVIELGPEGAKHYYLLLSMTSLSLIMQVVFAMLMFVLLMRESEMAKKKDYLEHLQRLESDGMPKDTVDSVKKSIINHEEDLRHKLFTSRLNYVTLFMVFTITVINMFITGFGIHQK